MYLSIIEKIFDVLHKHYDALKGLYIGLFTGIFFEFYKIIYTKNKTNILKIIFSIFSSALVGWLVYNYLGDIKIKNSYMIFITIFVSFHSVPLISLLTNKDFAKGIFENYIKIITGGKK